MNTNKITEYYIQQICAHYKFAVLLLIFTGHFCTMATTNITIEDTKLTALTVANIFEKQVGEDFVQIVFLESARFYKVYLANKQYKNIMKMAAYSLRNNCKVLVQTTQQNGDVIKNILPLGKNKPSRTG